MERKLDKIVSAILYSIVFVCMASQFIHNIVNGASTEGIILIGGVTFMAADLAWSGIRELREED